METEWELRLDTKRTRWKELSIYLELNVMFSSIFHVFHFPLETLWERHSEWTNTWQGLRKLAKIPKPGRAKLGFKHKSVCFQNPWSFCHLLLFPYQRSVLLSEPMKNKLPERVQGQMLGKALMQYRLIWDQPVLLLFCRWRKGS